MMVSTLEQGKEKCFNVTDGNGAAADRWSVLRSHLIVETMHHWICKKLACQLNMIKSIERESVVEVGFSSLNCLRMQEILFYK